MDKGVFKLNTIIQDNISHRIQIKIIIISINKQVLFRIYIKEEYSVIWEIDKSLNESHKKIYRLIKIIKRMLILFLLDSILKL